MRKLTVGEMAKLNNMSAQALRYYDKINLLKPSQIDEKTGYRYYHINQSAKLDLINHMKQLGMSLKKIKNLFEKNDLNLIKNNIEEQIIWIEEEKKRLNIMEKAVNKFKRSLNEYSIESQRKGIFFRNFPERKIFYYDCKVNIYDEDMETYELLLRELKKQVLSMNMPVVYFCNVGSIVRKNKLLNNSFYSSEIFVFVDEDLDNDENIEVIPANRYACLSFTGEEGFKNEEKKAEILIDFVNQKGLEIIGDYICEEITELPLFCNKSREMFIRIQVPVK